MAGRGFGNAARWSVAAVALGIGVGGIACQGDGLRSLRSVTYGPDFHYITQQEIRTTMGGLAVEVAELDAVLGKPGGAVSEDQDAVVASLTRMKSLAVQLKKGSESNHPRIHRDAPRLREDIQRALDAARMVPPNYFAAGRVVGACTYCHEPRHSTVDRE